MPFQLLNLYNIKVGKLISVVFSLSYVMKVYCSVPHFFNLNFALSFNMWSFLMAISVYTHSKLSVYIKNTQTVLILRIFLIFILTAFADILAGDMRIITIRITTVL
jgi:hypothetical protein